MNARIFQPWHDLARPNGVPGRTALGLQSTSWPGIIQGFRSLGDRQFLVFVTTALVLASSLLIPLSGEAVSLDTMGIGCKKGQMTAKGCGFYLNVHKLPAIASIIILILMAITVFALMLRLRKWKSGVSTHPGSIGSIASLSLNEDVRRLLNSISEDDDGGGRMCETMLQESLEDRKFRLGYFPNASGGLEYGIMLADHDMDGYANEKQHLPYTIRLEGNQHHRSLGGGSTKNQVPFLMLGLTGRILMLIVLCGMMTIILVYNNTGGDTGFERFMSGESDGVRFLFTSVGVIIALFWSSFFNGTFLFFFFFFSFFFFPLPLPHFVRCTTIAIHFKPSYLTNCFAGIVIMQSYQNLAQTPRRPHLSVLSAPPTNAFSGLWFSIRRGDWFIALMAIITIAAEALPILFANVPFKITTLFSTEEGCIWASVVILGAMLINYRHLLLPPLAAHARRPEQHRGCHVLRARLVHAELL